MTTKQSSVPLHWWQCDRKTLAVVGLLVTGTVGWLAMHFVETYSERQAVAVLEGVGARVHYDFEWDEHNRFTQPIGPSGLLRIFGHARTVNGHSCAITDAQLVQLNALPRLEILDLTNSHISGSGFGEVSEAKHLRGLYMARTEFNDSGLEAIAKFAGLKDVILSETRVSDEGIINLEKLANPDSLRLDGTRCTNEGLERLRKKFPKCKIVGVN